MSRPGGHGSGRGERAVVPAAEPRSYYGRPILKEPAWAVPDVPVYLFAGGMAGVSATMAAMADATQRPGLAAAGRYVAAGGAAVGVAALVHDLGRPERFLAMLRVFKPTSPLSVGSWILAPFTGLTVAAAGAELTGRLPRLGRAAGVAAAGLGPAMATYTAVLLADTAIPAWHEAYPELPFVFAGSALASAAGAALLAAAPAEHGPVRRLAVLGAGMELAAGRRMERRTGLVGEPYRTGRAGALLRAGRVLTAAGAGLAAAGRLSRRRAGLAAAVSGAALLAGGLATRFGILAAGTASARDPRYVVVPQRARLAERGLGDPAAR
ncbi:MAG TPA: NrfD/PsrC family molybdoenzyme membrane anchor subunit [Mycobacteriales bacterium]|nr:NrfD/PsrC family molybdoenzyme membrane anchor subunit [Mycobacteriales bacterium]